MASRHHSPESAHSWLPRASVIAAAGVTMVPFVASGFVLFGDGDPLEAVRVLGRPEYLGSLAQVTTRALCVGVSATIAAFPIAVIIAVQIKTKSSRSIILALLSLPFLVSESTRTFAWISILAADGYVNRFLLATGGTDSSLEWLYLSEFAVSAATTLAVLPVAVFLLVLRIGLLPLGVVESARELGATTAVLARTVIVPMTLDALIMSTICCAALSLSNSATVQWLGGPSQVAIRTITLNLETGRHRDAILLIGVLVLLCGVALIPWIARRSSP